MSEWKEKKLYEVCHKITDGSHYSPVAVNKGYPMLSVKDMREYDFDFSSCKKISNEDFCLMRQNDCIPQVGDVLVAKDGSYLKEIFCCKEYRDIALLSSIAIFRPNQDIILPDFLCYLLKTPFIFNYISKNCVSGSALPRIVLRTFKDVRIPVPDLSTQAEIAGILSSLDSKIENNRKICANLEAQAQALFKHWFIDFAPFKDGKFVESELGMIPEGWRVGRLSDYVDNLSGYSYKGSELQPSSIAMATIKNFVRGGGFKTEGYKEIVISKVIKDYQYINLFDVLVAHTDLTQNAEVVGNPAIVLSTAGYDKLIMSMDLTKVVSKDKRLTSPLIHSILSTRKFKEHALGYVNGTTVLHMSKKAVPEYTLAMPINLDVLKELTSGLNDLYQMMSETYAENLLLSTLRDTLLPKLMSGEIKV